ncbi:MAG TPA: hypothetical protein VNV44_00295 [Solirubrobacteraceae bacterium]|jgi:hypothetical protein|nr:hypothetical protein [Solirubrobacteraceae bacterium]
MHSSLWRAPARSFALVLCSLALPALLGTSVASASSHHGRGAHHARSAAAAIRAAAKSSNRADRRLVTQARALRACLREGGACTGLRTNVQRAGRAFTAAQRRLDRTAKGTGGRSGAVSSAFSRPPALRAGRDKLSWSSVARGSGYVLVAIVPGQGNRYSYVRGTSSTPPPVPGFTVTYMVRTAVRSSRWSNGVKISYPAPPAPPTPTPPAGPPHEELNLKAAPAVHVSGQTLSWNLVAKLGAYILMTQVPGQPEAFTAVSGTSVTPPAVPGKTVSYSVRTAVDGSAWSPSVSITYPAPPPKEPAPAPKESGFSLIGDEGFQPGINSGYMPQDYTGTQALGAKIVRISMPIGTAASAWESIVAKYASLGVRVAPLAEFYGRIPTPAEAQNLAGWAKAYGPGGTFWAKRPDGNLAWQTIEFGNETSYGYQYGDSAGTPSYQARAQTYALRLKEAVEAIDATPNKVGVLAVADDASGNWMNGMFQAVPNLGSYVSGWVTHPYGTYGKTKLLGVLAQTAAHGAPSNIPIDITEWGLSTDNGVCVNENYGYNPCMSYAEAAEQLRRSVAEIKSIAGSRLGLFMLYQVRDQQNAGASNDREAYFGLLQHEDQSKGPYTSAAQELLAL